MQDIRFGWERTATSPKWTSGARRLPPMYEAAVSRQVDAALNYPD
jgi:hypothetical protein